MKQERGEYPFEFFETVTYAFDLSGYEEWVEYAPKLSLLRLGILDKPSAPLLLVNGLYDSVIPIKDCYLLFEHGSPNPLDSLTQDIWDSFRILLNNNELVIL